MNLNPVNTSNFIYDRFSNYAATTLCVNDKSVNMQLKDLLRDSSNFSKGPIIEATPSYATGSDILQLVQEGVLNESFKRFDSPLLPLDRKLYKHQEIAIKKICSNNRNVIVATGTGERVIIVTGCINVLVSRVSGNFNKNALCIIYSNYV